VPVTGDPKGIKADVAMTVDVPVLDRLGAMRPVFEKAPLTVCIDHHVSNKGFADVNWVDPKAAAVGEMIFRLYEAFQGQPTQREAYCMYVSLGHGHRLFRYMSTTPAVHRIAAELISKGVSPLEVSQHLYESRTATDLKFPRRAAEVHQNLGRQPWWRGLRSPVVDQVFRRPARRSSTSS